MSPSLFLLLSSSTLSASSELDVHDQASRDSRLSTECHFMQFYFFCLYLLIDSLLVIYPDQLQLSLFHRLIAEIGLYCLVLHLLDFLEVFIVFIVYLRHHQNIKTNLKSRFDEESA